ncbi:DUF7218 family protein [Mangrovivirga cuniculi]|uniref:Rho termination factor n=1 Tax=Mangrovivirga cuniculi TaxID=2715131 RepID=A0A4D7K7I0_9BACT|nr:Rho termination factor N-terminal domain-containing protein [Mangrovivirga cuniculi]QCK15308.1 Rho termination factor [Mangrovivirga cuniculi]
MTKDHGKSVKNDEQYEELREKGMSKEKAARIANSEKAGKKGGKADKYENRTKEELIEKAKDIGIDNYSKMNKDELINALRNR